ncbi:hypothetical protein BAUCODRAFT_34754 [Baudoinia panamericana UAMH 10762]|uniref:Uncharacterized protein n=1 Tax=Baudoinia panamericana (strain UAMH 10762) TaxID=717646 RepID=M2NAY0_BAUPA|nr:uncharacterized protein BAUCODRAFT_34754 [Baudoinia panamericana UAMH 10762]EMC95990.1 hypothetical protein BAUCODRAFT_34754 [Baudoinia panamericana UAMH 10762]
MPQSRRSVARVGPQPSISPTHLLDRRTCHNGPSSIPTMVRLAAIARHEAGSPTADRVEARSHSSRKEGLQPSQPCSPPLIVMPAACIIPAPNYSQPLAQLMLHMLMTAFESKYAEKTKRLTHHP